MAHINPFARYLSETDALSALPEHPEQADPEPIFDPIAVFGFDRIRHCREHLSPQQAAVFDDIGRRVIHLLHARRPPTRFTEDGVPVYTMNLTDLIDVSTLSVALLSEPVRPDLCIDCEAAARRVFFGREVAEDEVFELDPAAL